MHAAMTASEPALPRGNVVFVHQGQAQGPCRQRRAAGDGDAGGGAEGECGVQAVRALLVCQGWQCPWAAWVGGIDQ
jgi:hypothetical protein